VVPPNDPRLGTGQDDFMTSSPAPQLISVNVGQPRLLVAGRRTISTAIWKSPVQGSVRVRGINLDGDLQADRSVHGGPDKAVYAYALEETRIWETELGRDLDVPAFGENLTTSGVDVSGAVVGELWRVGSTLLEVAQPRLPCFKLALRMSDPAFIRRFAGASRPGAYLRIIEEGELAAGDTVTVTDRPDHGVTVRMVSDALLRDPSLIPRVLKADQLPGRLRESMAARV
jgi:MOSC domain-containing protein YiiM